ncbi:hypothetical protein RND81_12G048000 [Saponaria officinalis]|uniref:Uncharacterized protein n=1 Tax=Saponaria officinalis TaxID=3572 RepID=A0AAW1H6R3_SAPOF
MKPRVEINVHDEQIRVPEKVCYVEIDPEAKTWIYPDRFPKIEHNTISLSSQFFFAAVLVRHRSSSWLLPSLLPFRICRFGVLAFFFTVTFLLALVGRLEPALQKLNDVRENHI